MADKSRFDWLSDKRQGFTREQKSKMRARKTLRTAVAFMVALAVVSVSFGGALAADTGWTNPANNLADSGGDGDGFETNPTRAYADGAPGFADNDNGDGDRHCYWGYNFGDLSGSTIDGIKVLPGTAVALGRARKIAVT